MADDQDIERLLAEIDAMDNPGKQAKPTPKATGSEVAKTDDAGGRGRGAWALGAGVGAGVAGGITGSLLWFVPFVDPASTGIGAALGGALVGGLSGAPKWFGGSDD